MDTIAKLNMLLQDKRAKGMTNAQMASLSGLSQPHINALLNGKRNIGGVSFDNVIRLFPELQIAVDKALDNLLNNDKDNALPAINQSTTIGGNAASINGDATVNNTPLPPDFGEIMPEIMASDMCDACKVKAYNIIHARLK